jgi:hypothetical protein
MASYRYHFTVIWTFLKGIHIEYLLFPVFLPTLMALSAYGELTLTVLSRYG